VSGQITRVLLTTLIWLIGACTGWCQSNVMQFEAYPPSSEYERLMGAHGWTIYASGEIDSDAGKRLAGLMVAKDIPGRSLLYLNSPGGSLVGGMALGKVIRKNFLYTDVGQRNPVSNSEPKPGYCYSACALAFLGGEYRFLIKGSAYGVHRFFWTQHTNNDADIAQVVSAAVVEYISSMGVDTKLFAFASEAGSSEIITPSSESLLALNVINNGQKPVKWSIESIPGVIYLKGQQETWIGINKFMMTCPASEPMELYAIFDAGQNANEVMTWPIDWLFSDGRQFEIQDRLSSKTNKNGEINLFYRVDDALLCIIIETKSTVGVGLSPAPGAAIFSGFNYMPFSGGAVKLPGFLQVCGHRSILR
jgi:hypothetical protein